MRNFAHAGKRSPLRIETTFCLWVGTQDLITLATCGDDRSRGLGVVMGLISGFHIDLRHRPYNTIALLCECVILMSLLAFCCLSKFSGIVLRKTLL